MDVLIKGEKKRINRSLIFLIVYSLEFLIQFIVAFFIPVIIENKKVDFAANSSYFIKVLAASLVIGTVLGVIVSKIIEDQEQKRFITVTEDGVMGAANESFSTSLKEFSIDFSKITSVDSHKNTVIINTNNDSYICNGYINASKIKDVITKMF